MNIFNKKRLLGSIFVVGWLAIVICIATLGWASTWRGLLIPTMSPIFADMRTVQGALTTLAQGFNPQLNNVGDPWGRAMNYPAVWIYIAQMLGLQSETNYFIFVMVGIGLFLYCCFKIIVRWESVWALLVIFSGAALLAVERGNNDLIVFSLLYFFACVPAIYKIFPIVIATALKIYPVLVIPAFIKNRKLSIALTIACFGLLLFMWQELIAICAATPVAAGLSYGAASIAAAAAMTPVKIPQSLVTILLIISVLVAYGVKFRHFDVSTADVADEFSQRLFLLGACTYIGTFLLSSNWDYRLIFLIFCVPYFQQIRNRVPRYLMLGCLLFATNQLILYASLNFVGLAINILSKCVLFVFMSAMVLSMLEVQMPMFQKVLSYIPSFPKQVEV